MRVVVLITPTRGTSQGDAQVQEEMRKCKHGQRKGGAAASEPSMSATASSVAPSSVGMLAVQSHDLTRVEDAYE
jgi:hypothetical protein